MPTYQYRCTECDHAFEEFQSFTDDALTVCPVCGGRLRKVFNAVGVVFKGSGFYRNDSRAKDSSARSDSSSSPDSSSTTSGSDSGSSSTTSGTSDTKPSTSSKSSKSSTASSSPSSPSTAGSAAGS